MAYHLGRKHSEYVGCRNKKQSAQQVVAVTKKIGVEVSKFFQNGAAEAGVNSYTARQKKAINLRRARASCFQQLFVMTGNTSLQATDPNAQATRAELFQAMGQADHENLVFCSDQATGLKAIIGIHNTVLGPALGGTRFWTYPSEAEALRDVLRLSRGMTYKAAISGINLGGGKAVVLGSPQTVRSEALWRRYGRFVESLGGKYITAEDVGTSTADMEFVAMETRHVAGKPTWMGGGGDPSPVTAYGVYLGMKAGLREVFGSDDLKDRKVAVEGVGSVGQHLVKRLRHEGAEVWVSDLDERKVEHVVMAYGARAADRDALYDLNIDVYAPCALGGTLNDRSIARLHCAIVAGAANNQLEDEDRHARQLSERGIVYCPDFLINAGGLINCYAEYRGNYQREHALEMTEVIYSRTASILSDASRLGISTHQAAIKAAEARIEAIAKLKSRK